MSAEAPTATAAPEELERLYASMLRIRLFEDAVHFLFLRNLVEGTTHLCQGQEAVAVGACDALHSGDTVAATYRGHGAALALGVDARALFAELLGRATGVCGGRGGSMNVIDLERGLIGCFGIVGGSIAAGTGAALAAQLTDDGSVALAFFGDGAVNQAYFHECLNLAGVRTLPIVYVCENNLYGEWTPMARVTAGGRIAPRAAAYGIPASEVDGNDVFAVREAVHEAAEQARTGGGPTLVECFTYRHKGHSRVDPGKYRPKEEVEQWLGRDPILRLESRLGASVAERLRAQAEQEIEEALAAAQSDPFPDPEVLRRLTPVKEA